MAIDKKLLEEVTQKAKLWLGDEYDDETKSEVQRMLENEDKSELIDAFYKNLEFGTGGLRGIMGTGSNRMNIYTVGAATQGLCNYLKKEFSKLDTIKVAIGYDCRNNSSSFAEKCADIFSANGIQVYLFDELRPTPELSFAIRELGCQSGIIITASHNPKEYNGYKVYWEDGSQIVSPHDINIINEVGKVNVKSILFKGNKELIKIIGEDIDKKFIDKVKSISLSPEIIKKYNDLKIVYTPLHGTGVRMIPRALKAIGFRNIINVPQQDITSGDFPTVVSPNPEEPAAMKLAMEKGMETDADVVMASDPDADRIGISVKDDNGKFIIVNGNQTAMIFIYYIITRMKEQKLLKGNEYIVKTIVTTEKISDIASRNGIELYDVYTGFKYIAEIIRELGNSKKYIGGGEESFGFMPASYVRDKDAISSCALMAEIAAWAKDRGKTLYELLKDIYLEYGYSKEKMKYVVRKGRTGAEEIKKMMINFRENPPKMIGGNLLETVKDYGCLREKNMITGEEKIINQKEPSNVLQYFTKGGTKISIRPSGTEPKIKFYFEIRDEMKNRADFNLIEKKSEEKIENIMKEFNL